MSHVDLTVLFGAGTDDLVVVDTLQAISHHSLLRPFAVLRPDTTCAVIDDGELTEVGTLYDYAAGRALVRVRIVRLSLDGQAVDPEHIEFLRVLRSEFSQYIEFLEYGTLTVLPDGGVASRDAFVEHFNFNLLIEPRDMAGEARFVPTRIDRERQITVAAAAIAAIGGLWTWLDEAPFDIFDVGYDSTGARVSLMRLTTRVIDAGDLTARSVAWALAPGGQRPAPTGTTRHGDQTRYVSSLIEQISPRAAASPLGLSFAPPDPYEPPGGVRKGWWQTMVMFFTEVVDELKRLPGEIIHRKIEELKRRFETAVQNKTFGQDSEIKVQIVEPSRFDEVADSAARIGRLASIPGLELGALPNGSQTWSRLGTILHGAGDGSEFPEGLRELEPEWDGGRGVLTDLTVLAVTDLSSFDVSGSDVAALGNFADEPFEVRPYDVLMQRAVSRVLDMPVSVTVEADRMATEEDHVAIEEDRAADADDAASEPDDPEATIDGETDHTESSAGEEDVVTDSEDAVHNVDGDSDEADIVDQVAAGARNDLKRRYTSWNGARRSTLLWRIGDRLVEGQIAAAGLLESTENGLARLIQELEEEQEQAGKRRKRFLRRALLIVCGLVLLVAIAVSGLLLVELLLAAIIGAVCLLGMLGLLKMAYNLGRDRVRDRHRVKGLLARDEYLATVRRHAAAELHRLIGLYDQFLDWSEVYATSIHHPWGDLETLRVTPWRTTTGALSFVCGEPLITAEGEQKATMATAQHIAKRGWLRDAYLQRRADWIQWYQNLTGNLTGSGGEPEADNETGTEPIYVAAPQEGRASQPVFSPRVHFRKGYTMGQRSERFRREFVAELREASESDSSDHIVDEVRCDVPGLSGRSTAEFTSPVVTWSTVANFDNQLTPSAKADHTIKVRSVGGITDAAGLDIPATTSLLPVLTLQDRSVVAAFRLDVTTPLRLDDTVLIEAQPGAQHVEPGDDEPADEPTGESGESKWE